MPDLDERRREHARLQALLDGGVRERLLACRGVYHVAVGMKERAGALTGDVGFRVYVREKAREGDLAARDVVPSEVAGVTTDVNVPPRRVPGALDENTYRPIVGGIKIANGFPVGTGASRVIKAGTLGAIGLNRRDRSIAGLTNWHTLFVGGGGIGSKIYQPHPLFTDAAGTAVSSQNEIGVIVDGTVNDTVDCGIVKVDTSWCRTCGVDWRDEIHGLALNGYAGVTGIARAVPTEHVFMVGYASGRRVEGVVVTDDEAEFPLTYHATSDVRVAPLGTDFTQTFRHQITIHPVGADPFGIEGDSGAVVVNARSEVVGLWFATAPATGDGSASHIAPVFRALQGLGIDFDVNYTAVPCPAVPHSGPELAVPRPTPDASIAWARARARLRASAAGTRVADRVVEHRREAVELVNRCRPVTAAWRREQGPAFVAHLLKTIAEPGHRIPDELDGATLERLVERMAQGFARHGSPGLRAALEAEGDAVRAAARGCRTFDEFAARLGEREER